MGIGENPRFFPVGKGEHLFAGGTEFKIDRDKYQLKHPLRVEVENLDCANAGLYISYKFSTGRVLSINYGCHVEEHEVADIALSFARILAAEQQGARLRMREAKGSSGENNAKAEKEELDRLFEVSKAA